jgi:hypothetical protein
LININSNPENLNFFKIKLTSPAISMAFDPILNDVEILIKTIIYLNRDL